MCGIAGWIDRKNDLTEERSQLEKMTRQLTARGPDAEGYWLSRRAAIGHRRLIVVDPEGGQQPMVRRHGETTYVLTYNGELYNTAELREILMAKGHSFLSYSDTEVLLVAYIEWGTECVHYFNGIYAFGIWNDTESSLFLARDRMGVKPLFYSEINGKLLFASELKALLAHDLVRPEVDATGLAEIFGLGPARTPGNAVYRGINELPPGFWLKLDENGLRLQRYWQVESGPHPDDLPTTIRRVSELVSDSIERQLVSDVPVGAFLSGGLDSSIIAAIASRCGKAAGKPSLDTFSIDYQDNARFFQESVFQPNSDRPWADRMARFIASCHHWIEIGNSQLLEALSAALAARDLPGMADIDASLFLVCREIKERVTVALSGECADEIFGGYPWFHRPETVAAQGFPWAGSPELRESILLPKLRSQLRLSEYINARYQECLAEIPRLSGEGMDEARRRELFYLNQKWFMVMLLERKDRMSMASGLEVRVPFCDHRLVEYVWNIPWEWKSYGGREKGILRQAMQGVLPDEVLQRKKSPYPKTHHPEYTTLVQNRLFTILKNPAAPLNGLIDVDAVWKLVADRGIAKPWFGQLMAGPQMMAYLIQVNTWLERNNVQICL